MSSSTSTSTSPPSTAPRCSTLRKQIDAVVRDVLDRGVAAGQFVIDDLGDTALALLSIVVDVARWYSPTIHRSPREIGETNAALALRLVGAAPRH